MYLIFKTRSLPTALVGSSESCRLSNPPECCHLGTPSGPPLALERSRLSNPSDRSRLSSPPESFPQTESAHLSRGHGFALGYARQRDLPGGVDLVAPRDASLAVDH